VSPRKHQEVRRCVSIPGCLAPQPRPPPPAAAPRCIIPSGLATGDVGSRRGARQEHQEVPRRDRPKGRPEADEAHHQSGAGRVRESAVEGHEQGGALQGGREGMENAEAEGKTRELGCRTSGHPIAYPPPGTVRCVGPVANFCCDRSKRCADSHALQYHPLVLLCHEIRRNPSLACRFALIGAQVSCMQTQEPYGSQHFVTL
jgi:hypothetical protein